MPVDFKPKSTVQFKPKEPPKDDLNILERGIIKLMPHMETRIREGKTPPKIEDVVTPGYGVSLLPEKKINNPLGQVGYDIARSFASPEGALAGPGKIRNIPGGKIKYKTTPGITTPPKTVAPQIVEDVVLPAARPITTLDEARAKITKAGVMNRDILNKPANEIIDYANSLKVNAKGKLISNAPQIDEQAVSNVMKNKPTVSEYLNIPRAFAAAGDISAPFRQGLAAIGRKEWWTSWKPMIQSLASDEAYQASQAAIKANPKFTEAVESGLSLGEITTKFEEQFASRIANKIPGIKHSNRAYTAYLNNLRMDLFANLSDKATKLGVQYDPKILAAHINTLTGRGSMGLRTGSSSAQLEKAAEALNTMFFSPRLIASRVQMLNPASYTKMDAFTRKEALRDLATLVSVTGMTSGVAAQMGLDVETDPTSADFAKIKSGNTRVDHMGGFQQYVRLGAQIFDRSLDDREAEKFVRYKLSPTANLIGSLFTGEDALGRPAKPEESVLKAFVPMLLQDAWELYHEDPEIARTLGFTALASTGVGVQSYGATEEKRGAVPNISLPSR